MFERIIIGIWLFALYVTTTAVVIFSLSANLVQHKIKNFSEDGNTYSVGRITSLLNKWEDINKSIDENNKTVNEIQARLIIAENEAIEAKSMYEQTDATVYNAARRIRTEIMAERGPSVDEPSNEDMIALVKTFPLDHPAHGHSRALMEALEEISIREIFHTSALQKQELISKQLEQAKERLNGSINIKNTSTKEIEANEKLKEFLSEFVYFKKLLFGWPHLFAIMPASLLTLIMALSMGALGSVIYLTKSYFSTEEKNPFSWYFFRPFLGMITALAIFVLAKAGVLVVAGSSGQNNISSELSPFFISFLAIISGLLSEQATDRIKQAE